jgi:hypothetical protein
MPEKQWINTIENTNNVVFISCLFLACGFHKVNSKPSRFAA